MVALTMTKPYRDRKSKTLLLEFLSIKLKYFRVHSIQQQEGEKFETDFRNLFLTLPFIPFLNQRLNFAQFPSFSLNSF